MSAAPITRIVYAAGNEHSPSNPWGRAELAIEASGAARLDQRQAGQHRAWTGTVDAGAVERLHTALLQAGFPTVPPHPVPGGATIRSLSVMRGDTSDSAMIAWHSAKKIGYGEVFEILDSIVRQLSEDTVQWAPSTFPDAVRDVARV